MNLEKGDFFSASLIKEIKEKFYYVDKDMHGRNRLFFDNAGGSFRLKSAVERLAQVDALPDCPERAHELSIYLQEIQAKGTTDFRLMINAESGSVYTSLTASGAMFDLVRAVAENVAGSNMVTTVLEHPSSFDAMVFYAEQTGKELRVANSNLKTGGVDVSAIINLIDQETTLLSVIYASNISGAKLDLQEIVRQARGIKPDLYIVVDAVQHAPHGLIDLQKTPVDGLNIAPYKFFGCRGSGIAWVSERASKLPHHKLSAKNKGDWELGSPAPWQFAVITEIMNYVCWLGSQFTKNQNRQELFACGMNQIELHERALLERLLNGHDGHSGLRQMDGIKVLLDHEDLTKRDLILAIDIENMGFVQAVREYERRGVIVYERVSTSLYSARMLESFGLSGSIRVSPLHCNSPEDIDLFLNITRQMCLTVSKTMSTQQA